jgi:hypothetical protein
MATKKKAGQLFGFFRPLFLLDLRSEILKLKKSGSGNRHKHPRSATLQNCSSFASLIASSFYRAQYFDQKVIMDGAVVALNQAR